MMSKVVLILSGFVNLDTQNFDPSGTIEAALPATATFLETKSKSFQFQTTLSRTTTATLTSNLYL